jgi:hypothetical protein
LNPEEEIVEYPVLKLEPQSKSPAIEIEKAIEPEIADGYSMALEIIEGDYHMKRTSYAGYG